MTESIIGLDPDESRDLLDRVFEHVENDAFVYEHRRRPGDLLLWGNRCSTHGRTHFNPNERRMLRRIAIKGDLPR